MEVKGEGTKPSQGSYNLWKNLRNGDKMVAVKVQSKVFCVCFYKTMTERKAVELCSMVDGKRSAA